MLILFHIATFFLDFILYPALCIMCASTFDVYSKYERQQKREVSVHCHVAVWYFSYWLAAFKSEEGFLLFMLASFQF